MLKKIFFYFLTVVLSLFVFLVFAEIIFRLVRGAPASLEDITQKQSNYLFAPNDVKHKKSTVEGEFEFTAHINSFGYRGKNFSFEKQPGVVRIFAVGDSFVYGVGANDEDTIPYLIERQLQSSNLAVEVINAGVGHASPVQHLVNIRDMHLKYKPDLVLFFLDLTDLWDDWHYERIAVHDQNGNITGFNPAYRNGKRDWWITACYYSAFAKYMNDKVVRTFKKISLLGWKTYFKAVLEGKRAKALIVNLDSQKVRESKIEYDGLLFLRGREEKELIDEHWQRTARYIKKIKVLLDEQNIPMVLVMYPHGIYVGKDQWHKGRATWGFKQDYLYTDYYPFELGEQFAKENNMGFINVLPTFTQNSSTKYFYDWDGHMTPAGNKVVAQTVASNNAFLKWIQVLIQKN